MAKHKPKTMFTEAETKALIVRYYRIYEHRKLESVSIVAVPEKCDSVKSLEAKCTFCVKYKEVIANFEKVFEEWVDPEDICQYLERMFADFGYRGMTLSVRAEMDDKVWNKDSDERDRKAYFAGVVFEYTDNIERKVESYDSKNESMDAEKLIAQSLNNSENRELSDSAFEAPVIAEVLDGPDLGLKK